MNLHELAQMDNTLIQVWYKFEFRLHNQTNLTVRRRSNEVVNSTSGNAVKEKELVPLTPEMLFAKDQNSKAVPSTYFSPNPQHDKHVVHHGTQYQEKFSQFQPQTRGNQK